jgi:hypothetical protein
MSQSRFAKQPITLTDKALRENPEMLERVIIRCALGSMEFYRAVKDRICPFDSVKGTHRMDFSVDLFNPLWKIISYHWLASHNNPGAEARWMDPVWLEEYLVEQVSRGYMNAVIAEQIKVTVFEDMATIPHDEKHAMSLVGSSLLGAWISNRVIQNETKRMFAKSLTTQLSREDFNEAQRNIDAASAQAGSNWIQPHTIITSTIKYRPAILTGLPDLDRAMGGGFYPGETHLVAAATGGGKSILAAQFLLAAILKGRNFVLFMTEQGSANYIYRMVSNYTNTPFSEFVQRGDQGTEEKEINAIPDIVWNSPEKRKRLEELDGLLKRHVWFADWSNATGNSIVKTLEPEMASLARMTSFRVDGMLFDWVGGALNDESPKEQMRFVYQEGADYLVKHCKVNNIAGVAFCQAAITQGFFKNKFVGVQHIAEAKAMAAKMTGFIGVSSLKSDMEGKARLDELQFLNVDKGRNGPCGPVKVKQNFRFQRFESLGTTSAT